MRLLVVDDSVVFRSQIKIALQGVPSIEVVAVANNGKIALQKLAQTSVDLITLDMEMPEMGGIETIREIRKIKFPVRIIVFSSHTTRGSEMTLEALAAGADDFVAKPSGTSVSTDNASDIIRSDLLPKILQFIDNPLSKTQPIQHYVPRSSPQTQSFLKKTLSSFKPSLIVIGSSTGGPPALEKALADLTKPLRCPILITQHMPPVFTAALAKRLQDLTGVCTLEAKDQEDIQSDRIYIAPGGYHLSIKKGLSGHQLKLDQGPPQNSVRPAVDPLFISAAECFGSKCMGFILTGMGEDGLLGCKSIKSHEGGVMIQDRASCVVFGMPGAVFNSGYYDEIGDLQAINKTIRQMIS